MVTNLGYFKKYKIFLLTGAIQTDHGFENTSRLSYL